VKDIEVYKGKKISDILADVVRNCEEEKTRAIEMYDNIKDECSTPEQMMLIGPVAANYLEIASKQTDNLIKLANAIQKIHATSLSEGDSAGLSDVERNELFGHLEEQAVDPLTARHKKDQEKKDKAREQREITEALEFSPKDKK
tara:strand:- start:1306 stop:1737 length:432 start_codon:yes stop_codon:yes gene_type:complete